MHFFRQRIGRWVIGCLLMAAIVGLVYFTQRTPPAPRRLGPDADFRPQVYLWQRAWNDSVVDAVRNRSSAFGRIIVLARQIDFGKSPAQVIRVPVDWAALKASGTPVGAAIRIGAYSGSFEGPSAGLVVQSVRSVIADARAAKIELAEIQVDFDAATSRLAGYRHWLALARQAAGGVPVTLTALPAWLNAPAFAPLVRDAGYFVLQVHWLDRPRRVDAPLVLCDISTARRAIEKAGLLGVPFRVAFPTYSYLAAFNADGSFAAMVAENAPPHWAQGKIVRRVEANPQELASFTNELAASRPMSLRGVIWYRLPIDADRLNWSWTTLKTVMAGQIPAAGTLTFEYHRASENLYDLALTNTGQQDADTHVSLDIHWSNAAYVAADALGDFQLADSSAASLRLLGAGGWEAHLKPGESRTIGWLRLSTETTLHATLGPPSPSGPAVPSDTLPGEQPP